MINQAENPETGTVAVRRQKQLGVSSSDEQEELGVRSSEEHKTFFKASRWGYSRAATDAALDVLAAGTA